MKINTKANKRAYFEDVEFGQVFQYTYEDSEINIVMKINNPECEYYNAVDLKTGDLFGIDDDERVTIIDVELIEK